MSVHKNKTARNSNQKSAAPVKKKKKRKPTGPRVVVREPDQKPRTIWPGEFNADAAPLESVCEGARISIVDLSQWPDENRKNLIRTLANLDQPHTIDAGNGSANYENLFDFTLHAIEANGDVKRCGRSINAAIEAAALAFAGDDLNIACSKIMQELTLLGIRGYTAAEILRRATALANTSSEAGELAYVMDVLPGAPVVDDLVVPLGWVLSPHGISRNGGSPIDAPVIIAGRTADEASGEESLALVMLRDGEWKQRMVARKIIANQQLILELASYGLPVNSNNAKDVVKYLSDFEAVNREKLPVATTTHCLGWHGRNRFLCGKSLITPEGIGKAMDLNDLPPVKWPEQALAFRSLDAGQEELAGGFRAQGDRKEWLDAIRGLERFPKAQLGLYASFVPPLMEILPISNFTLEFAGPSSRGKTTVLRLAASVWGDPDERSGSTATLTWDSTRVFLERAAAVRNHLPLIVDDTKRAKRPEEVTQLLYDVAAGRGRGRGSIRGTARTETYQTVLLMSGESPACSFKQDGGSFARVLSVWGSPFDSTGSDVAAIVTNLNARVLGHYGHAGRAFVHFLLNKQNEWPTWRKLFLKIVRAYESLAKGNPVAHRVARYCAAVDMAARLVHRALKMPWAYKEPVKSLWPQLIQEANGVDRAAAALRHVMSWANSHEAEFLNRRDAKLPPPNGGFAGRWDKNEGVPNQADLLQTNRSSKKREKRKHEAIMFFPHKLDEILRDGGFDPESVRRTWKDNGWLITTTEKGRTERNLYKARLAGSTNWLVAIRLSAVEAAHGGGKTEANA